MKFYLIEREKAGGVVVFERRRAIFSKQFYDRSKGEGDVQGFDRSVDHSFQERPS